MYLIFHVFLLRNPPPPSLRHPSLVDGGKGSRYGCRWMMDAWMASFQWVSAVFLLIFRCFARENLVHLSRGFYSL